MSTMTNLKVSLKILSMENLTNYFISKYHSAPVFYIMTVHEIRGNRRKVKIGITENLPVRHNKLELSGGQYLRITNCVACPDKSTAERLENHIQSILADYRHKGEYYFLHKAHLDWLNRLESPRSLFDFWNDGTIWDALTESRKDQKEAMVISINPRRAA